MAKIKWSAIGITNASGKSGGSVFSFNRNGAYVRRWAKPVNKQTSRQTKMRSGFGMVTQAWGQLSQNLVDLWNNAASTITKTNSFGDSYNPTGFNYFVECNFNRIHSMGLEPLTEPLPHSVMPALAVTYMPNYGMDENDIMLQINATGGDADTDYMVTIAYATVNPNQNQGYGTVKNKFVAGLRVPFQTDSEGNSVINLTKKFMQENFGEGNIPDSANPVNGLKIYLQIHTHSMAGQKSNPVTAFGIVTGGSESIQLKEIYRIVKSANSVDAGSSFTFEVQEKTPSGWETLDSSAYTVTPDDRFSVSQDGTDTEIEVSVTASGGILPINVNVTGASDTVQSNISTEILVYPEAVEADVYELQAVPDELGPSDTSQLTLTKNGVPMLPGVWIASSDVIPPAVSIDINTKVATNHNHVGPWEIKAIFNGQEVDTVVITCTE